MSGYNIRLITIRDAYEGLTAFYLCIVAGLTGSFSFEPYNRQREIEGNS
jgi:hypothetical protein